MPTWIRDSQTGKWIEQKPEKPAPAKPKPTKVEPVKATGLTLAWPLLAGFVVTQTFAEHLATKIRENYKYYNGGLDLAYSNVREGEPVYAAAPGDVIESRWNDTGYGNYVKVQHPGGYVTLYAHLQKIVTAIGKTVTPSDIVGKLGGTGNCWGGPGNPRGVHLHFELRLDNVPVDPMPYMVDR